MAQGTLNSSNPYHNIALAAASHLPHQKKRKNSHSAAASLAWYQLPPFLLFFLLFPHSPLSLRQWLRHWATQPNHCNIPIYSSLFCQRACFILGQSWCELFHDSEWTPCVHAFLVGRFIVTAASSNWILSAPVHQKNRSHQPKCLCAHYYRIQLGHCQETLGDLSSMQCHCLKHGWTKTLPGSFTW